MVLERHASSAPWIAAALLLAGSGVMLPFGDLHILGTVPWFLVGAGLMLAGWALSLRMDAISLWMFWAVAVLSRGILVFQIPGGDIYRYVWEGKVLLAGFNPYALSPDSPVMESLRDPIWVLVQYKTFTAIYPPLIQVFFALLAGLWASPLFFKIIFALADLILCAGLAKAFSRHKALVYAWNPLVIYSFAGGGHYDVIFLLLLTAGWLASRADKDTQACLWLGAAIAVKWLALPLAAWQVWKLFLREGLAKAMLSGVLVLLPLTLSWLIISLWTGTWTVQLMPSGFTQHARSAEFLPALVEWIQESTRYHNDWTLIPLALAWAVIILRAKSASSAAEWLFFSAFVISPMLHAWYFTWLVPFAVLTRNRGTLLLTVSGFVYFLLYHNVELPGGFWRLEPWQTGLLWIPFVWGFLHSEWHRLRNSPLPT